MLKLYNTLWHTLQDFKPLDPSNVRIYSCGPTVYSTQHLGNMRSAFFTDMLKQTLKLAGYEHITHVVNITDVGHLSDDGDHGEDKMEKGAKREGLTARDVAKKYTQEYLDDLAFLQLERFEFVTPATDDDTIVNKMSRATDHIAEQITMIQRLGANWHIYEIPGDGIYMDTSTMPDYWVLTNQKNLDNLASWVRVKDTGKRNPTDFALWKFNTTGKQRDMERASPRWVGFPGRHIECSAMATHYLGDQFDIHTWGIEHIPIHHTNEIAQSECSGAHKPRVNYRLHNQRLMMNGKKIAKSDGNVVYIRDIKTQGYSSEDVRYFFLQAHYRSFKDFSRDSLEAASKGRKKLKLVDDTDYPLEQVIAPLLDDLNTPQFLANLHKYGISQRLNDIFHLYKEEDTGNIEVPTEIKKLAAQRRQAKLDKDYDLADQLRNQLSELGWEMKDGKAEYSVTKK